MTKAVLGPTSHSALGGSSADRYTVCYASARLNASLPAQPDTKYTREGTRAHALAQHCLESGKTNAAKCVGSPVPGHTEDTMPVSQDMADAVQVYLDMICEELANANGAAQLYVEQKFKLPYIGPDLDGSVPGGTNDACIFYPATGYAHLIDYKHGAGKFVDIHKTKQLLYYGLGAQAWFEAAGIKLTGLRLTIVQPRCTYSDEKVRSVDVSMDDLFDFREEIMHAAYMARKPDAPFTPGAHCKGTWCKGALQMACEAFKSAATAGLIVETKRKSADIFAPPIDLAPQTLDPTRMDTTELGKRMDQAPILAAYLECLQDHARAEAVAGRMPVGYEWKQGRATREWTAPESEVLKVLRQQTNGADFEPRKLVSVPQAEKLLGKSKFDKAESVKALWAKKPGGPVLGKTDNGKPAYIGNVNLEPVETGDQ